MAEPIKFTDLIKPDDTINELIQQLRDAKDAYEKLAKSVKTESGDVAKALQSTSGATEEGKQKSLLVNGHNDDIHSIKSCVDTKHNELIASCSKDGNVCLWDFNRNNKPIRVINTNEKGYGSVNDVTFTSEYVVSAHVKGKVAVWDMQSGKLINEIDYANNSNSSSSGIEVRSVNTSLDGKYLLCCGFDQKVKIFDVVNEFKVVKVLEHDDRVVSCKWHPVIPCFVSTSADKTARVWLPSKY